MYVATIYAKCIISEYSLPDEEKSIQPLAAAGASEPEPQPQPSRCRLLSGKAGRRKYFIQGVLFKLASDFLVPNARGERVWMFGGKEPSDGAIPRPPPPCSRRCPCS